MSPAQLRHEAHTCTVCLQFWKRAIKLLVEAIAQQILLDIGAHEDDATLFLWYSYLHSHLERNISSDMLILD